MRVSINEVELKKLGIEVKKDLLSTNLSLDGEKLNYPIIVEDGQYLVVRGIERGNIACLRPNVSKVVYYAPYFTWDGKAYEGVPVYPDISSAFRSFANGQKLELRNETPIELYDILRRDFEVSIEKEVGEAKKVNVYKMKASLVEEWLGDVNPAIKDAALKMLTGLNLEKKELEFIKELFSRNFEIFASLKIFLGKVNSIFCSSTLNIGALTGMRLKDIDEDTYAIYTKNDEVYILAPRRLDYGYMSLVDEGVDITKVLDKILIAPVGVEEKDLELKELEWIKKDTIGITNVLREWRESIAYLDLPFYIIGSYITKRSIEKALKFLQNNPSITERQVYEHYTDYLKDTLNSLNLPDISIDEYFVVLHAGDRTLIPSVPSDHVITSNSNTLKLDAGIKVLDKGVLRAISDLARTLPLSEEAKRFYQILKKTMIKVIIPSISAGKRGCDIHKVAIDGLKAGIKGSKFIPKGKSLDEYNRDMGHVFGRQEPVTISLIGGNTKTLNEGMVGSVELQWSYKQHAFGVEDSYLVGPDRGINFTSGNISEESD